MKVWTVLRHLVTQPLIEELNRQVDDFRARREAERRLDDLRRRVLQLEAHHIEETYGHEVHKDRLP